MSPLNTPLLDRWSSVLDKNRARHALWGTSGEMLGTFEKVERESRIWEERFHFLPPRSAVGIQFGNHPTWPSILLALWRGNHIALPLDSSLPGELTANILNAASAQAVIQNDEIQRCNPHVAGEFHSGTCLCKVTSGTSGMPRLIEFTGDQLLADSDNICTSMGLTTGDINYGAIPFSHSYGFSNLLTPLLTFGIPLVVADDYLPHSLVDGIARTQATVLAGVPILYQSLTRLGLKLPESVRLCITAGAPLNTETARLFYRQNNRKIHSFYGASECGGICYDGSETVDVPAGFVGHPLQGVEVEPIRETGKIIVRGRAVGLGYHPIPDPGLLANGEFRPQDLVEFGIHGIRITGRESDFINIAGKKLDPQVVETVIEKMAGVSRAVVFGIPDVRRGELVIAAVEANGPDAPAVMAECRKKLASWQLPSDVWMCGTIPVSERGKISRPAISLAYRAKRVNASP